MQERAALVDGTLEIDSAPGQGTRLCARIPYAAMELNDDDPPVDG
jgi:signal transduction histidine kinase